MGTEGKDLCEQVGVEGFPTIRYGDPSNLEDYEGGRDFSSLQKFAKENLGPRCGPANLDLCDAEMKTQIDGFMKMPATDLKKAIEEKEGEKKRDDTKKAIKEAGLGLMKSVQAHRKSEKS